ARVWIVLLTRLLPEHTWWVVFAHRRERSARVIGVHGARAWERLSHRHRDEVLRGKRSGACDHRHLRSVWPCRASSTLRASRAVRAWRSVPILSVGCLPMLADRALPAIGRVTTRTSILV